MKIATRTYIEPGDIKNFREDQARISISEPLLRSLALLVAEKLRKLDKKEESKDDSA